MLSQAIFEKIGFYDIVIRGDELHCPCPFHKEQTIGAFSVNLTHGAYFCFSCLAKGNIFDLFINSDVNYQQFLVEWNRLKQEIHLEVNEKLDKHLINYYKKNGVSRYGLSERKIASNVLLNYSVYEDENWNPVFFVRDFDGDYLAFWKRVKNWGYLLIEPLTSKKHGDIFGSHLPPTKKTIVTEGFFDALSCYQDTGEKSVCLSGTWITDGQLKTLEKMQPLYLMLDGDKPGKNARNALYEKLIDLDVYFCGGYKCDPDELTKDQKFQVLENAKSRVEYYEIYRSMGKG